MNQVYENVVKVIAMDSGEGGYYWVVRVWFERSEAGQTPAFHEEKLRSFLRDFRLQLVGLTAFEVAKLVSGLTKVNAVEVTDINGRGSLVYNDWP